MGIIPRSGSSRSSGSVSRTAVTSWRRASRPSACSQPVSLMKSDTTNSVERRRTMLPADCSSSLSRVGPFSVALAKCGLGRLRCRVCISCSTCWRPPRAGSTVSAPEPYSKAPTRLPWPVSSRARMATKRADTSRLRCSLEPKSIDGLRSSKNQAVISRSSVNTRTCGCCSRAVTFQSMWRTSSWNWYSRRSARSMPVPRSSVR